jgi:hypothetical protein
LTVDAIASIAASTAASATIAVAVVPSWGDRVPAPRFVPLLYQALQDDARFRLVERDRVADVLRELRRSNSGLSESDAALSMGRIVAADVLVMVRGIRPTRAPAGVAALPVETSADICLLDTRTGILLDHFLISAALARGGQALGGRLRQALVRRPAAGRARYLGILDVRSEEPGHRLDSVAEPLRALVESRLSQSPDVFLLDREDLARLIDEKNLADLPVDLKTSSSLLTCGIRRDAASGDLSLTLKLTHLLDGKCDSRTLPASTAKLPEAGATVASEVLQMLSPDAGAAGIGDRAAEARLLTEKAAVLESDARFLDAARCSEGPLALLPSFEAGRLCSRLWRRAADDRLGRLDLRSRLRAAIRADEIQMDLLDELALRLNREPRLPLVRPEGSFTSPLFWPPIAVDVLPVFDDVLGVPVSATDSAVMSTRRDLIELELQKWETICRINRQHGWPSVDLYECKLGFAPFLADADHVFDFVAQANGDYARDVQAGLVPPAARARYYARFAGFLSDAAPSSQKPKHRWNQIRPAGISDPFIELLYQADSAGLFDSRCVPDAAAAKRLIEAALAHLPGDLASQKLVFDFEYQMSVQADVLGRAVRVLAISRPDSVAELLNDYVSQVENSADSAPMTMHAHLIATLLRACPATGRLPLMQRVLALSPDAHDNPEQMRQAEFLRGEVANLLDETTGLHQPKRSPWDDFEITKAPARGLPEGSSLRWAVKQGNDLFLLVSRQKDDDGRSTEIQLLAVTLPNGQVRPIACGSMPVIHEPLVVTACASLGDKLYFSTRAHGLICERGNQLTVLSEADGIVSNSMLSLAADGDKLYLGFADGLACYFPATGSAQLIASSHAVQSHNALDGGHAYQVRSMHYDSQRQCMWIGITGSRAGLWRIDCATNRLAFIPGTESYVASDLVPDGALIDLATTSGPARFDPSTERLTPIKGFLAGIGRHMALPSSYCLLGDSALLAHAMLWTNHSTARPASVGFIRPSESGAMIVCQIPGASPPAIEVVQIQRRAARTTRTVAGDRGCNF